MELTYAIEKAFIVFGPSDRRELDLLQALRVIFTSSHIPDLNFQPIRATFT